MSDEEELVREILATDLDLSEEVVDGFFPDFARDSIEFPKVVFREIKKDPTLGLVTFSDRSALPPKMKSVKTGNWRCCTNHWGIHCMNPA